MTEPTDAEILAINDGEIYFSESPTKYPEAGHGTQYHAGAPGVLSFARAVLAKWGAPPAVAGEPAGRVVSANCQYATVEWHRQTSEVGGGDPDNSRSWPITGDAVYLAPQPTQAQAGAVPLTDEQIDELIAAKHFREGYEREASDLVCINWYRMGLRDGEHAHGIGIKGGQHGADQ